MHNQSSTSTKMFQAKDIIADAEAAMEQKDWTKAISLWEKVLSNNKDQTPADIYVSLSVAHRMQGSADEAEEIIEQALEKYPDSKELVLEYAKIAKTQKNWTEAAKRLQRLKDGDINSHLKLYQKANNFSVIISIVIPAYNPHWFEEALLSAINQDTTTPFEIIVCDDSSTKEIACTVKKYKRTTSIPIRYFKNKHRLGESKNLYRCILKSRGMYIKPLYDDDIIDHSSLRKLLHVFKRCNDVNLVSSRRSVIDENGNEISLSDIAFKYPFNGDVLIDSDDLVSVFGYTSCNFIGEPSCVMFRKDAFLRLGKTFNLLDGRSLPGCGDFAIWINLLKVQPGRLGMLDDTLAKFRHSSEQVSHRYRLQTNKCNGFDVAKEAIRALNWFKGNRMVRISPLNEPNKKFYFDLLGFWQPPDPDMLVCWQGDQKQNILNIRKSLNRLTKISGSLKTLNKIQNKIQEN